MYGIKIPKPHSNTLQTDTHNYSMGFSGGSEGKESACNARDLVLIPVLGRFPGKGNGTHSNILPGESPWTEEPGRLQSVDSQSRT